MRASRLIPTTLQPLTSGPGTFLSVDEPFEKDIDSITRLQRDVTWDLGSADSLNPWQLGYSDSSARTSALTRLSPSAASRPSASGRLRGISFFDLGLDVKKITQEFRLTSTGSEDFQWQLGAFYTEEDADNSQLISLQAVDGTPTPFLDPLADLTLPTDYTENWHFSPTVPTS